MIREPSSLLDVSLAPFVARVRESCGLDFEPQVVEIPVPGDAPELFWLGSPEHGPVYPVQRSRQNRGAGFLLIEISAQERVDLEIISGLGEIQNPVERDTWLSNGKIELAFPDSPVVDSGPVKAIRLKGGQWRGTAYFDLRDKAIGQEVTWLEAGPVRTTYRTETIFAGGGHHRATVTLDAGQDFAVIEEEFETEPNAQFVWEFGRADWTDRIFLLDTTPGGRVLRAPGHVDTRHARLWCWTQYQQLLDLSDGFGLLFPDEVIGFVALEGGSWRGNRLNHMELWTRRLRGGDRRTRREPWESKADYVAPDGIPSRGASQCSPNLCIEGWIGHGRRKWALAAIPRDRLFPDAQDTRNGDRVKVDHFEHTPDVARYRQACSRLRRIHVRHGMFPLTKQAGIVTNWPEEPIRKPAGTPVDIGEIDKVEQYLAARIYGFWNASPVQANCVVGRNIAPAIEKFESWVEQGALDPERRLRLRAWFAWLTELYASDDYYPAETTMLPLEDPEGTEPTLSGMANQNFLTDCFNIAGVAAQVFHDHPAAADWRSHFGRLWKRQLDFHRYPQSGVWEESHTYFLHVLHTVLPALNRRRDDGVEDGFADPRFQSLGEALLRQITPRVANSGGFRHPVAFGDHHQDRVTYHDIPGELAAGILPHHPQLARHLAWLGREMDGPVNADLESEPVTWGPEVVEGLGVFFRSESASSGQSLLALRTGGAWGHHHNDDGSIQFFAHGRALIVDSGFGRAEVAGERKFTAAGHSRWSPRQEGMINHLWRHNRGWAQSLDLAGEYPAATAYCPVETFLFPMTGPVPSRTPIEHRRTVIQLAPAAFLILDVSDATEADVRFHVPETAFSAAPDRVSAEFAAEPELGADAVTLHMISLTGDEAVLGVPDNVVEKYPELRTREIKFPIRERAAFLVCSGKPGLDIRFEDRGPDLAVAGGGWSVLIERDEFGWPVAVRPK